MWAGRTLLFYHLPTPGRLRAGDGPRLERTTVNDAVSDTTHLRRQVGDELRAVIDTLLANDAPPGELAEALRLLGQARDHLQGPELAAYNAAEYRRRRAANGWDVFLELTMFGGLTNPLGMPMPLELGVDDEGRAFAEGVVRLGRAYVGGPGMVHGGYVAALIDHVFGAALHAGDTLAVTATLTVRYREPTPIDRDLRFRAVFDRPKGRRLRGRATCHCADVCTAEAEGLFLLVDMNAMEERAAQH